MKFKYFLELLRPANIITAIADIWGGFAISGALLFTFQHFKILASVPHLGMLTLSSIFLYVGGAIFNDYFDIDIDAIERPERPLPKGVINGTTAVIIGSVCLFLGVQLAFLVGLNSGIIASCMAFLILFYAVYGKHQAYIGPLVMGLWRGGNLLLGISLIPHAIGSNFIVILIPIVYISAIASLSRYEVTGGHRWVIQLSGWLYMLVICYLIAMAMINDKFMQALPFIAILFYSIFKPITIAFKAPTSLNVTTAVKTGIISLILLNACLAATFSGIVAGLIILALMPVSLGLSKYFAVT